MVGRRRGLGGRWEDGGRGQSKKSKRERGGVSALRATCCNEALSGSTSPPSYLCPTACWRPPVSVARRQVASTPNDPVAALQGIQFRTLPANNHSELAILLLIGTICCIRCASLCVTLSEAESVQKVTAKTRGSQATSVSLRCFPLLPTTSHPCHAPAPAVTQLSISWKQNSHRHMAAI